MLVAMQVNITYYIIPTGQGVLHNNKNNNINFVQSIAYYS